MTNTIYPQQIIRDDDSVSSSSNTSQRHTIIVREGVLDGAVTRVEASSLYTAIGKACLSCTRPLSDLTDDNSSLADAEAINDQATTGVSLELVSSDGSCPGVSSHSVSPTLQSENGIVSCSNIKSFTFAELKTATRNFHPSVESSCRTVFKGYIDEHTLAPANLGTGITIAVKFLKDEDSPDHTGWLERINHSGHLYHPNLVWIFGYCLDTWHPLIVYEFMPRGSLENNLFWRGSRFQPLSWSLRMKIALGAAKGLSFLHSAKEEIIPGNFKPSNILLDSGYNAKLCYFGLTKERSLETIHGLIGYDPWIKHASPEYHSTGTLNAKCDVYSFGVVLLEILSGRRAFEDFRPYGEQCLVEWAKPSLKDKRKYIDVLDSRLEGQYPLTGSQKAANLTLQCLSIEAKFRPNMDKVVKVLQKLQG